MRSATIIEDNAPDVVTSATFVRPVPVNSTLPRRRRGTTGLLHKALGVAALIPVLMTATITSAQDVVVVDVVAVAKGYRTSKLTGRDVINNDKDVIGQIDDFIIGHDRVLFTILQIGGFLGIGSHLIAVPYKSLDLESSPGQIVLKGASKAKLKQLPEFKYRERTRQSSR